MIEGTFDYGNFTDTIIKIVKDNLGVDLVLEDDVGPQPEYPYFSYTITSPHISVTQDVVSNEVFELVMSITCHDKNSISVLDLAETLRKSFREDAIHEVLRANKIAIANIESTTTRDIPLIEIYEYRAGFDIHLRVQDSFAENLPQISTIDLTNKKITK